MKEIHFEKKHKFEFEFVICKILYSRSLHDVSSGAQIKTCVFV